MSWKYAATRLLGESGTNAGHAPTGRNGAEVGGTAAAVRPGNGGEALDSQMWPTSRHRGGMAAESERRFASVPGLINAFIHRYFRARRQHRRAELFDSLATMLDAGLSLLTALDTLVCASGSSRSAMRSMLVQIRDELRHGSTLADAMARHPGWFDGVELAMIRAGQHGSAVPSVLRTIAEHRERASDLHQRLLAALSYPAIVAAVGLTVVAFLSAKTLPELAAMLDDAKVPVPRLTRIVIGFGQWLGYRGLIVGAGLLVTCVALIYLDRILAERRTASGWSERAVRMLVPRVVIRLALARLSLQLAELLRCGVPVVQALRVVAPAIGGPLGCAFSRHLLAAADEVERGEALSTALRDDGLFDREFQRLIDLGQSTGELEPLLERIGQRYMRQARRMIDHMAAVLEPLVIILLSALIGAVVMAAVAPLLKLQEIVA